MIKSCWTKSERWREIGEKGMAGRQEVGESQKWEEKSRRKRGKRKNKEKVMEKQPMG